MDAVRDGRALLALAHPGSNPRWFNLKPNIGLRWVLIGFSLDRFSMPQTSSIRLPERPRPPSTDGAQGASTLRYGLGMKRIGLLGGMSWESTALYYKYINEAVRNRLGGLHSADLIVVSVDFAVVEKMQASGQWDEAGEYLAERARTLEQGKADAVVLCTNTMHKVAPQLEKSLTIPLIHVGDATARAVLAQGIHTVGLLGTRFTMEQNFYRRRLEDHGLTVLVPEDSARDDVHRIIYEELCQGIVRESSRKRYLEIVQDLVASGAQGTILGCTEIEMLLDPDDTPELSTPCFSTTRLHALAAVDIALDAD